MIRVYTDLNCPYCFLQHERLLVLPIYEMFQWHFIEHDPSLITGANTRVQLERLKRETDQAMLRGHDITFSRPEFCVNSGLAILSLLSIESAYPDQAARYRTELFRAYWLQHRDISRYDVLQDVLTSIGLTWIDPDEQMEQCHLVRQQTWQYGDFKQRIPAMQSSDNRVLLGLQNSYNVTNFVNGVTQAPQTRPDACQYFGHFHLGIIGFDNDALARLSAMPDFICHDYANIEGFREANKGSQVDAVILALAPSFGVAIEQLTQLRECVDNDGHFPILCLCTDETGALESLALQMGACDFSPLEAELPALRSRIRQRITTHKTIQLLSEHAHIDGLTGLNNRRSYELALEREWRMGCRNNTPLSVIMVDCDDFKSYNDRYGHFAGDECLRQIAEALARQFNRPSDIVARMGGEEFVILLPNTKGDTGLVVAERARLAISDLNITHTASSTGPNVSISCGVACAWPHADQTPLEFMQRADEALYLAKSEGRNRSRTLALDPPAYAGPPPI